jgi:hypothetical protein
MAASTHQQSKSKLRRPCDLVAVLESVCDEGICVLSNYGEAVLNLNGRGSD